ncbi:hypothetical protein Tco_0725116 [Tanacetum coccineum]|uniref:Reverse transcriptase domain-containing protein n=1 Tax=Tanacetum coccineum TaxID=301880 RepID=A0ABQ4YE64_9ASTR
MRFLELHQLDTFYNSLNSNDQDALDSAAGGNFLDKMPQEGLAIIESKSKVRYSRSRASDSRVSTDAPLSNSSPSNNSFDMQQIAASLEDKMTIKMKQMMNEMKALVVTTPAPVKAVEEVCVTCGSNHHFNHCPLTRGGNDFPVFHDNIQQFQQTAAIGNFLQRNQPSNLASQMKPPGFNQPNVQNNQGNQSRYQGNNFNSNQNRGNNFNQVIKNHLRSRSFQPLQPINHRYNKFHPYLAPTPQIQGVSKTDFENYVKANDAVLKNVQTQGQNLQNQMANVKSLLTSLCDNFKNSASTSNSGTLPSQTVTNPRQQINAITKERLHYEQVPVKHEDPGEHFLSHDALQESIGLAALADSGASINFYSFLSTKKLALEALTSTRRPFPSHSRKLLIALYEETLTLRVGKDELVYYADKSEKNKSKHCVHAISVIDFSKDDPFSGSTTTHSDDPSPSSSPVKTSDNFEKFADELAPLDSLPPGNDDSTLKKDLHEENFQVYSNPLFEFDDNFKSSSINPLFDEMEENVEIKNSNEPVLLNTPLSDKVECFAPEDNNDEIDDFLAMEVSSNLEEGYFDSEGDVVFLDNLLSDDSHNLASEVISDHEPKQNESSITFSPRSDPIHHEFVGEPLTLPARNDREFKEYLSLVTVLYEISTSQGNVHQNSVIESLPISPIPVEDSEPTQEEIDILLVPDDLIPPGVEDADSEDEVNESPNLDHQDDPSIPRPPPEPPDIKKCFEPEVGILIIKEFKGVSKSHDFMTGILPTHTTPFRFCIFNLSFVLLLFENEDTIFDPGIST